MHCRAQGATVLAGVHKLSETKMAKTTAIEALENKGVIVRQLDITDETSVQKFKEGMNKLIKERQLGRKMQCNAKEKFNCLKLGIEYIIHLSYIF